MTDVSVLFEPFRIKSLALKNRIVMAPMTRARAPDGVPGEANAAYYRRRAENEVGLILSEGTVIDRPAVAQRTGHPVLPRRGGAGRLAARDRRGPRRRRQDGVRSSGTSARCPARAAGTPDAPVESPSGLLAPGEPRGVAMSDEDIADTIAAFAAPPPTPSGSASTRSNCTARTAI